MIPHLFIGTNMQTFLMHSTWRLPVALLLVLLIVATASASSAVFAAAAGSASASSATTAAHQTSSGHQPRFTVENAQGSVPLNVTFHDVSTVANVSARAWDFGDGTNGTERDPVHAYTVPGSYTVTLKLATANGTTSFQMANVVRATGVPTPTPSPAPLAGALAGVVAAALILARRHRRTP